MPQPVLHFPPPNHSLLSLVSFLAANQLLVSHNAVSVIHTIQSKSFIFFHTLPSQILNRHLSHTMQSQSPVSHTAVTDSYMFHTLQSQLLSWHLFYTQQSQSLVSHTAVTDSYMFHTLQSQILNLHLLHTMRSQTVTCLTQCSLCHLPPHLYHKAGTNYRCNGAVERRRTGHRQQSVKWRPQQVYGSNQVLFAQLQTIFSTPKILTRMHR